MFVPTILPPGATVWDGRTPEEVFQGMASRHGETIGFVIEDLLALPKDRAILVDWFGTLPGALAPLLRWPEQALFLVPTAEFRRAALSARYADPERARADWGDRNVEKMLAKRYARDDLWDAEFRRQAMAEQLDSSVLTIDGSRTPTEVADYAAACFRLDDGAL